ncbi:MULTISPECIES: hypothetical protein [Flavobacterium]|uniref:Lipoprotein n=1 Tax=Flavobacterium hankyongi TaxID=1176532 RepID=A0ABP8ZVM5_9FLAO|nr:hypothetical protein [Flavobacterium sp. N1846]
MRKINPVYLASLFLVSAIMFIACEKDENSKNENKSLNVSKIGDKQTIQKLQNYIDAKSIDNNENKVSNDQYDFENAEIVLNEETGLGLIVVKSISPVLSADSESLMVGFDGDLIYGEPLLLEINNETNSSLVKVFDIDKELISTFSFDYLNNSVVSTPNTAYSRNKPCDQATMDCISDAYSNHGWTSVGLGMVSAFIPETFGVMAIACYDRVCR